MSKKGQSEGNASHRRSGQAVRTKPVEKEILKTLVEIDFSREGLKIRIERSQEQPINKEKKQSILLIIILIAFLICWNSTGKPAMTIDELIVTLLQFIQAIKI